MPSADDEQPLLLATLPPPEHHYRIAIGIIAVFVLAFAITVPFANTPMVRFDAWLPAFAAVLVVNDFITAALLFSQFSIAQHRGFLVLASGYLFSGFVVVPYALTFPGVFGPTGLLGAGVQSAVWLYIIWHLTSPVGVIVYALMRDAQSAGRSYRSVGWQISLSIALALVAAIALTWFVTARHDLLPRIYLDNRSLAPAATVAGGLIFALCAVALLLLWRRRGSVLGLWLMVTVAAWLLEITLNGVLLTDRFSLAWYVGRTFALIASGVVLTVLLSEMTTLYTQLARAVMRQRAARQGRRLAMDTMAASIAHEINQPLAAIVTNSHAALRWLDREAPDLQQTHAALKRIVDDSHRASAVISGVRSMYQKDVQGRANLNVNDALREALNLYDFELRGSRIAVAAELRDDLPLVFADRGQLQQVFQNLIVNAIEAMRSVPDRERMLRVQSGGVTDAAEVVVTIEDSGPGIDEKDKDRIFEPFFTTKSGGMGMGLSICYSIVESHDGRMVTMPAARRGSVFQVVLPAARA